MKILNQTYRDSNESTIQKTPISELDETTRLPEGSLIHIVMNDGNNNFESKKMTTDVFKQKIYDSVQNTFKTAYWDTHEKNSPSHNQDEGTKNEGLKSSFKNLVEYLKSRHSEPEEVPDDDPDGFVNHIYYDFDVLKRYVVLKDNDLYSKISTLDSGIIDLKCYFATTMKWVTTTLNNDNAVVNVTSDNVNPTNTDGENVTYCQMKIDSGNKISNEWTCHATGNLVIYGWLDSSACLNNKATPSAFCAIEGFINENWEIISVCPVTPAKNITYVGFNLLVQKGLKIRARTGFVCGVKSGQFPNQQDGYDTLSNSTANGFKCKIYLNEKGTLPQ